ncbi:glycosyltransferase [Spirochaetota bacterium]
MIRVAALTSGRNVPSTRFRIRQHIQPLAEYDISAHEYCPVISKNAYIPFLPRSIRIRYVPPLIPFFVGLESVKFCSIFSGVIRSRSHDVVWLERGLYPGYPTIEFAIKKPLVLDVDDAVWFSKPFGELQMRKTAQRADRIVVGNQYLAEWFSKFNKNIIVLPTTIDTDRFLLKLNNENQPFTIGWTGTSGNFNYLYEINSTLKSFFSYAKDARMLLIADKFPEGLDIPFNRLDFIKWSEENENSMITKMDVGIMPLQDNLWTRGKCSFKMLQYMACGKPVIVSPVGMNTEVLEKGNVGFGPNNDKDWLDALVYLYENRSEGVLLGQNGRQIVEKHYCQKKATNCLADIFNSFF